MTATVNVEIEGRSDVLSVPNAALRRDASGSYVLVPGPNGAERRTVEVGFRGEDYTEVPAGLDAGERVILGNAVPCGTATAAGASR